MAASGLVIILNYSYSSIHHGSVLVNDFIFLTINFLSVNIYYFSLVVIPTERLLLSCESYTQHINFSVGCY